MAISIRTDEEIQTDVLEELKWDTHMRPNEIGVVVSSLAEKKAAEETACSASGVTEVDNHIIVSLPV